MIQLLFQYGRTPLLLCKEHSFPPGWLVFIRNRLSKDRNFRVYCFITKTIIVYRKPCFVYSEVVGENNYIVLSCCTSHSYSSIMHGPNSSLLRKQLTFAGRRRPRDRCFFVAFVLRDDAVKNNRYRMGRFLSNNP